MAACVLLQIIPLVRGGKERSIPGNLARAIELAESARRTAADGKTHWDRLLAFLDARRSDKVK